MLRWRTGAEVPVSCCNRSLKWLAIPARFQQRCSTASCCWPEGYVAEFLPHFQDKATVTYPNPTSPAKILCAPQLKGKAPCCLSSPYFSLIPAAAAAGYSITNVYYGASSLKSHISGLVFYGSRPIPSPLPYPCRVFGATSSADGVFNPTLAFIGWWRPDSLWMQIT